LDEKKRFRIHADWYKQLKTSEYLFVIVEEREESNCLAVMTQSEMIRRMERLEQIALAKGSDDLSMLAENSEEVRMDQKGRLRICDELLDLADIKDKVVVVPAFNRLLLWSPERVPAKKPIGAGTMKASLERVGI
jgi:DNA-binding transcriptional regulator/RsmH inhibitor MraZ